MEDGTSMSPSHTRDTGICEPHIEQTSACELRDLLDRLADKWSLLIVELLGRGTRRFTQLRREIDGISQRMLTLTLRQLERDGLVLRTVYPVVPPRVDYELTALGRSLQSPVIALGQWATENLPHIQAARAVFDATAKAG